MDPVRISRRYIAGVDGGGTKTACIIADENGLALSSAITEGSNHQISGFPLTVKNVCLALDNACMQLGISRNELSYIYLGMAGADSREDLTMMNQGFSLAFGNTPFQVVNDIWIAFACEANLNWGAVSICGTGNNLAVKDRQEKTHTVRALRYVLGNYGGGRHLAEIAMHWAFRCDEHTGPNTLLVDMLPSVCNCADMDELALKVYESGYQYYKQFNIPKLVFELAEQEDKICMSVISEMGIQIGTMLGRLICHAKLGAESIPVILAGSLYTNDSNRLMIGPLEEKLRSYVPLADVRLVECPPVFGAVLKGLEAIGITVEGSRRLVLRAQVQEMVG